MKHLQKGFTLIELIVVIVILGILSAVALPKFIDFKSDAATSAVAGVAGGLSSASAINYAASAANKSVTPSTLQGVSCGDTMWQLLTTGNPDSTKYTITSGTGSCSSTTVGSSFTCGVQYSDGTTTKSTTAALTCY